MRDGDTLQGIAAAIWGDASLWYMIAEANGLTSASLLSAGQTLTIPAKAGNVHNTAETFRPYDPNKALGDVNPTQPKPPAKAGGCGGVGQILMVVIAVVVAAIVLGPLVSGAANFFSGAGLGTTVGAGASTTASAIISGTAVGGSAGIAAGSAAGIAGAIAGGAMAGAAASVASQLFGVATGIQEKFDWKAVGLSALSGGVGAGMNFAPLIGAGSAGMGGMAGAALRGAASSIVTQGVAVATGLQEKFSWTSVAVSAVMAGVGKGLTSWSGLSDNPALWKMADYGTAALVNTASAVAGAATMSALDGTSFGDNLIAVLPQAIGQTIGQMVAGGIQAAQAKPKQLDLQVGITPEGDIGAIGDSVNPHFYIGDRRINITVTHVESDGVLFEFPDLGIDPITFEIPKNGREIFDLVTARRSSGNFSRLLYAGDDSTGLAMVDRNWRGAGSAQFVSYEALLTNHVRNGGRQAQPVPAESTRVQAPAEILVEAPTEILIPLEALEGIRTFSSEFGQALVKGDYHEGNSAGAIAGKIIGGFNPFADIRDFSAAVVHVAQGREGAWVDLAAAGIGFVPIVGDVGKVALKHGDDAIAALRRASRPEGLAGPVLGRSGRYGDPQQREALLNAVQRAGTLSERRGIVYGTRRMNAEGWRLEPGSLSYGGSHGVDLPFSRGDELAVLEAKHGRGINRLSTDTRGLRQGSEDYNIDRLEAYLRRGDGSNDEFALRMLDAGRSEQLRSYASFYRRGRLYELPRGWASPAPIPGATPIRPILVPPRTTPGP